MNPPVSLIGIVASHPGAGDLTPKDPPNPMSDPRDTSKSNIPNEHNFTYCNHSSWPPWITVAVHELDGMSDALQWKMCITEWLLLEHCLGYPVGMVGDLMIVMVTGVNITPTEKGAQNRQYWMARCHHNLAKAWP